MTQLQRCPKCGTWDEAGQSCTTCLSREQPLTTVVQYASDSIKLYETLKQLKSALERIAELEAALHLIPRCPTCGSPDPKLHPAMQYEGEVQECQNPWHKRAANAMEGGS